jgi:hypothetical protein
MYYAGWNTAAAGGARGHPGVRGHILSATSPDGRRWTKEAAPTVEPGGAWDAVKCSEPCVFELPGGGFRLLYEAHP